MVGEVCMAGGHAWRGVHSGGCMVGACMAGGCVWQREGVCGRGHAWQGVCMAEDVHGKGACVADTTRYSQ